MYITFDEYTALYEPIEERIFNRLVFDACRHLDRYTSGADGVKKLKEAFPTDEEDAVCVKNCAAALVHLLNDLHEAEVFASTGRGYRQTENGLVGRVVSSVSAGNESVSYAVSTGQSTALDAAVADLHARETLIGNMIRQYLSGVADANGVNLLYMGVYPRV